LLIFSNKHGWPSVNQSPPRYFFKSSKPQAASNSGACVTFGFLSDIHLGTRACQAERLLDFLREYPPTSST
jgi:hypothetical protein